MKHCIYLICFSFFFLPNKSSIDLKAQSNLDGVLLTFFSVQKQSTSRLAIQLDGINILFNEHFGMTVIFYK